MSDERPRTELLANWRILLVEDDPLISLDLETSLSDLGAITRAAFDANTALQLAADEHPDFAILDFELTSGTSEPVAEFCAAKGVPFVFLSGYGEQDERFQRWAGTPVLVKPISVAAVVPHIEALGAGPKRTS